MPRSTQTSNAPDRPGVRRGRGVTCRCRPNHGRRGGALLLALLFMVLFAVMAIGFYSSTTISVQTAANDLGGTAAQRAAESGVEFMRYHLEQMEVPEFTTNEAYLGEVQTQLTRQLAGTPNMGANTVGRSGDTLSVPAASNAFITVQDTSRFRATMRREGGNFFITVT